MALEPTQPLPLDGIRVLDFTQNLPGPYATFMLASWGAQVTKVEPPRGDSGRFMEPFFGYVNAGKRSFMIDLRKPENREVIEKMIARADVLVEGFRPGVMQKLGCSWAHAQALNPRLVYCSISAFGQEGPRRHQPAHDLNIQALTGACFMERDHEGQAGYSMLPIADLSSSLVAVSSICAALRARDQHGQGTYLDVTMSDALLSWTHLWGEGVNLAAPAKKQLAKQTFPGLKPLTRPLIKQLERLKLYTFPHYGVFSCADGNQLTLGIVDEEHFWRALVKALGLPNPMAKLNASLRTLSAPLLRQVIALRLRQRPRAHWLRVLEAADVPVTPVLSVQEAKEEPQFRTRGLVDPNGRVRSPLPGARAMAQAAPALGEHNAEILEELIPSTAQPS